MDMLWICYVYVICYVRDMVYVMLWIWYMLCCGYTRLSAVYLSVCLAAACLCVCVSVCLCVCRFPTYPCCESCVILCGFLAC